MKPSSNKKSLLKSLLFLGLGGMSIFASAQVAPQAVAGNSPKADTTQVSDEGIAVTPSSLRLFMKPGETAVKEVKVTNKTKKAYTFSVSFNDFDMGDNGKPQGIKDSTNRYALSRWLVASPSYFELQPGQVMKIQLTVSIPADEAGKVAGWTIMSIDQIVKREAVNTASSSQKTVALGVIPSFGFGIYVYQNPPDAGVPEIEIDKFERAVDSKTNEKRLHMHVKSKGQAIGFCNTYAEITNTGTGEMFKLPVRNFTILPGFDRSLYFSLPKGIAKGKYSVIAVVDYGSKEDMKAAEMELSIE